MTGGTRRLAGTLLLVLGILCLVGLGVLLLVRPEWQWWLRGSLAKGLQWGGAGLLLAGFGLRATAEGD
ncbi:hypothetical protein [Arsenicicoccus dermatophilus]|uniref:hypothetical protein n=1 Tax=Arsenicicoccus dermatophilus TaxID=1076331 RepID=UPI003917273E